MRKLTTFVRCTTLHRTGRHRTGLHWAAPHRTAPHRTAPQARSNGYKIADLHIVNIGTGEVRELRHFWFDTWPVIAFPAADFHQTRVEMIDNTRPSPPCVYPYQRVSCCQPERGRSSHFPCLRFRFSFVLRFSLAHCAPCDGWSHVSKPEMKNYPFN